MAATADDSLRLVLELPARVPVGAPVRIGLRVENVSGRPLDLYLRGRAIAFDLIVRRAEDGAVVWRRLEGAILPAILRLERLGPGEALQLEDMWDQRTNAGERVMPGAYSVRGELLTERDPLRTPAAFLRIEPR